MARMSAVDERYMGSEPVVKDGASVSDIAHAYNWYNYFHDNEDAKNFVIDYLKAKKANNTVIGAVTRADPGVLRTIGWNCRILLRGGALPQDMVNSTVQKLQTIISKTLSASKEKEKEVVIVRSKVDASAIDKIGDLEALLDAGMEFDVAAWMTENNIGPLVAKRIVEYYQPLSAELDAVLSGQDETLKEGYARHKKSTIKKKLDIVQSILVVAGGQSVIRRKRKKKVRSASKIVSKVSYLKEHKEDGLSLTSVDTTNIVGAAQVWLYNVRYRTLTQLDAAGPEGMSVKGTTIQGFDEKASVTKKIRKPNQVLPSVLSGSKVALRKLMNGIRAKPGRLTGRMGKDTIILRTVK